MRLAAARRPDDPGHRALRGLRLTHIGGPTLLVEFAGWRLLTDPTFDPPGRRYPFGWGSGSRKVTGPAVPAADLLPVDAVLISHDQHGDNLDDAGRAARRVDSVRGRRPCWRRPADRGWTSRPRRRGTVRP